jgi:hypothetical protein
VNRLVTLVGRAPECKIRLSADDIAAYHCGLVLTPAGLWVVDLSGRGVVINGERMRVSPLLHGAELWIGRFLIGLSSRTAAEAGRNPSPAPRNAPAGPPVPVPPPPTPNRAEPPDDEVPLGVAPPPDPLSGLPSSHIMADAFQLWGAGPGGVSHPILVSGSGPPPMAYPIAPSLRPPVSPPSTLIERLGSKRPFSPEPPPPSAAPRDPASTAMVAALLRELGELHGQMLTQFEQSLGLMVRLFACLGPEQLPAMQRELTRIQELNSELGQLQVELARRASTPAAPTPPPIAAPASSTTPAPDSTALHDWVAARISSLQKERQERWQSLVGMFAVAEGRGP